MTTPGSKTRAPNVGARIEGFARELAGVADARGRADLAASVRGEVERLKSVGATLVVAGEAKRGKSSLVNALLGRPDLVPVDADVATNARIVLRHGSPETVTIFREGGDPERVTLDRVGAYASVAGNPLNEKGVHLVDVALEHPLLASGVTLIDTPGVGGLEAGHAEITLAALGHADALLFVVDASAPMSRPELTFLSRATSRIGTVLFVLTKRDLYAGWERILKDNRQLLAEHAPRWKDAPFLPVSSRAAQKALTFHEAGKAEFAERLKAQSGYSELEAVLTSAVSRRVRALRRRNVLQVARGVLAELEESDRTAVAAADGDPRLEDAHQAAAERKREFSKTKHVGTVALGDEFTLLGQHLTREWNRELHQIRADYDHDIRSNRLKPEAVPEALDAHLRAAHARLEAVLNRRVADIAQRLERELAVQLHARRVNLDVRGDLAGSWSDAGRRPPGGLGDAASTYMPTLMMAAAPSSTVGLVGSITGGAVIGAALPIAAVAGLALMPLAIVQRRRIRDQQEAARRLQGAIERARTDVPPSLTETVLTERRRFEQGFQAAFDQRERELADALDEQQRVLRLEANERAEAQAFARQRLSELRRLQSHVDELDAMAAAATDEAATPDQ
ncbi:MAG: dynamin family protein [Actinomycetota bacterium]|nr:dynamin family protein [Actinomycetota bacterium]